MPLTRRRLLHTGAAGLGSLAAWPMLPSLAFAATPAWRGDSLVVIFLRGGCDGLSLVAPSNDTDYVAERGVDLRVSDSGPRAGHRLAQTVAPAIDFRLHPEAGGLADLYAGGHLAVIHAAGLTNETRSHFVAQEMIERGLADANRPGTAGWISRLLDATPSSMPAIATSGSPPTALALHADSLAVPDLRGGLGLAGGEPIGLALKALYEGATDPFGRSGEAILSEMGGIDARLPRDATGKLLPYVADGGSPYEETDIGRGLMTVARLLKMDIGLSVACVDMGGWDHHENMAGRFNGLAGQLSRALTTFWNDTARTHDRLSVVVMTEFGRRLRSNKSNGTDHGHGAVMLALGGGINGGAMYGRWPGLSNQQLDNAVDLSVTTDYRTVLAEIVTRRLGAGAALPAVFPGFTPPPGLGLTKA